MNSIIIILYLLSFLLIWQFVGYPTIMGLIALRAKSRLMDYEYKPFVTVLIAAYNEEKVIGERIKNLVELDYPKDKYEIIIVDDGSSDTTTATIREAIIRYNVPSFEIKALKKEDRGGKASALMFGKKEARGEIILITDANSVYDKDVLKNIVPHFKDPKVGVVTGRYMVSNPDKPIASSESFYWDIEHITFLGESALDSVATVIGSISAWRANLVNAEPKTIGEDLDMTIQARSKGYSIKYEPDATVYEAAAATPEDQIKQRKRTSTGTIQNTFRHLGFFLAKPSWYAWLIFPSHKTLTMLSPFILIGILLGYAILQNVIEISMHLIITAAIFALLLVTLLQIKNKLIKIEGSAGISLFALPKIAYYVLLNEYLILLAWKDVILGRYTVLWEKSSSTR